MTKSELISKLMLRSNNMSAKDVAAVVDCIFGNIAQAMQDERRVEIRGFGAFSVRKRNARKARNPRTNEVVEIGERSTLYFRAGKELKEKLNN